MSKYKDYSDKIALKVFGDSRLSYPEKAVFWMWYVDSIDFNAPQILLAERTGMSTANVSRCVKNLILNGYLEVEKKYKRSIDYRIPLAFIKELKSSNKQKVRKTHKKIYNGIDNGDVVESLDKEEQKDIETTPMNEDELALEAQKAALVFKNAFSHVV